MKHHLVGATAGEVIDDAAGRYSDSCSGFNQAQANRIDSGVGPFSSRERFSSEAVQQDVGECGKQETKLIR